MKSSYGMLSLVYLTLACDSHIINMAADTTIMDMAADFTNAQVSVAISPAAVTVETGQRIQFAAKAEGTNNSAIEWSIAGGGLGQIDQDGWYTAPQREGSFVVVARSRIPNSIPGMAHVLVVGPKPILCDKPFVISGHRACNASVRGIDFQYFPLDEGQSPSRLAAYFHGDTARELGEMGFGWSQIVPWAKSRNILIIAPRAPNAQMAYGQLGPEAADSIAWAIEAFVIVNKILSDNLLYWSASGGSWYITYAWIPLIDARLPGIYALSCGGAGLSVPYEWNVAAESPRNKIKLFLNYGTKDFLADRIETSYQGFQRLNFDVTRKIYDGATHCAHPIESPTIDFFSSNL
jgi:hypothetical protein